MVKNLLAVQETQVQSLDREDPLEKEMATHSCILAWKIPWTEEPGGLQSMGVTKSRAQLGDTHIQREGFLVAFPEPGGISLVSFLSTGTFCKAT